jgi:hypothetical protein
LSSSSISARDDANSRQNESSFTTHQLVWTRSKQCRRPTVAFAISLYTNAHSGLPKITLSRKINSVAVAERNRYFKMNFRPPQAQAWKKCWAGIRFRAGVRC